MSRTINNYQSQSLYVGPAPSTGFYFVNSLGVFNNDYTTTGNNFNLVKSLNRIQNCSYGFDIQYTDITHLGRQSTLHKAILNPPNVHIDFSYIQNGVSNENRCGLYVNYTQQYGTNSGLAIFPNNLQVGLISGFVVRDSLIPGNNEIHYPFNYRDKRNLFLINGPPGQDTNIRFFSEVHPNYKNLGVIGFGNCYLNGYSTRAAVGEFSTVSMSYIAENMVVYNSGSGLASPAVDYTTRQQITNKNLTIPSDFIGNTAITALKPGDITFNLTCLPQQTGVLAIDGTGYINNSYPDIYNLASSFTDIKIQNYDISLPLNRTPIFNIGSKLPCDRTIDFPVYVSCNIAAIIGDLQTGNLLSLLNNNDNYNVTIKLKNPKDNNIAVQYDLIRAKFNSISYSNQIGGFRTASLSFGTEIDLKNYDKGFFISGLLNIEADQLFNGDILKEDGGYILQENGDKIIYASFAGNSL